MRDELLAGGRKEEKRAGNELKESSRKVYSPFARRPSPVPKSNNITPILRPAKLSSAWLACKGRPSAYAERGTFDLRTGLRSLRGTSSEKSSSYSFT